MTQFILRFAIGGLVVAVAPVIANQFGPQIAGLLLLVPIVTLLGFTFIYRSLGIDAVQSAALASLKSLPALVIYLVTIYVTIRAGSGFVAVICLAITVWLSTASLMVISHWIR